MSTVFCLGLGVSCSSKDSSAPADTTAVEVVATPAAAAQQQQQAQQQQVLEPLAATPDEMITLAATAAESAGAAGLTTAAAGLRLADGPLCAESGEPVSAEVADNACIDSKDSVTAVMCSDHAKYVAAKFYCTIAFDTGDAGSIQGAFSEAKMIACLVGDQLVFDGEEHEFTMAIADNPCFGDMGTEGLEGIENASVTATATEPAAFGGDGWQKSVALKLSLGDMDLSIDLLYSVTDKYLAFAVRGGGTPTDAYSIYVSPDEGILRYNGRFQRLDIADGGWSRQTRVLITGTMDADGSFTDVERVEGAAGEIYNTGDATAAVDSGRLSTIKGENAHGFRTNAYSCGGGADACGADDVTLWSALASSGGCYFGVAGADCAGNAGLELLTNAGLEFLMKPTHTAYQTVADWIAAIIPFTFTEVTLEGNQE